MLKIDIALISYLFTEKQEKEENKGILKIFTIDPNIIKGDGSKMSRGRKGCLN